MSRGEMARRERERGVAALLALLGMEDLERRHGDARRLAYIEAVRREVGRIVNDIGTEGA